MEIDTLYFGLKFFRVLDVEVKRNLIQVFEDLNDLIHQIEDEKGFGRTYF